MKIELRHGIPYIEVIFKHNEKKVSLKNVVLDTGSGGTVFSTEIAIVLGLEAVLEDNIHRIRGIGGTEYVYEKTINSIMIGDNEIKNFKVQIGAMNYGFNIDAILGMDFLRHGKFVIDCNKLEILI